MNTTTEARRDEGCAPTACSPAGITPQRVMDLARVVAFAKENGFPDAEPVYWDEENPEYGQRQTRLAAASLADMFASRP